MSRYLRKEATSHDLAQMLTQPPRCDFCGSQPPQWLYAAHQMTVGIPVRCWRWSACEGCAERVEAGRFDQIILAIAVQLEATNPRLPRLLVRQAADRAIGEFHQYAVKTDS